MLRAFIRCSVLALPLAGCGATEDDTERLAADDRGVLDACELPSPCQPLFVSGDYVIDGRCLFEELGARRPVHLTKSSRPDGGDCETRIELYTGGSDTAIVWTFTHGADCASAYSLEACVLKTAPYFSACATNGEIPDASSACYSEWFESCTALAEPTCP